MANFIVGMIFGCLVLAGLTKWSEKVRTFIHEQTKPKQDK